jgi:drug/metabolite transporter (DMT)-like permease
MWTLLASALVLRERVTPVKLVSVLAVMAGVGVFVSRAGGNREGKPSHTPCRASRAGQAGAPVCSH